MDQSANLTLRNPAILAGLYMVGAGIAFAAVNSLTQLATLTHGTPSTAAAFWQYLLAFFIMLPMVSQLGSGALKTKRPVMHVLRVIAASIGVQLWVLGLAKGVPIWQAIALIMTSTFFVTISFCAKPWAGPAGPPRFWVLLVA